MPTSRARLSRQHATTRPPSSAPPVRAVAAGAGMRAGVGRAESDVSREGARSEARVGGCTELDIEGACGQGGCLAGVRGPTASKLRVPPSLFLARRGARSRTTF